MSWISKKSQCHSALRAERMCCHFKGVDDKKMRRKGFNRDENYLSMWSVSRLCAFMVA